MTLFWILLLLIILISLALTYLSMRDFNEVPADFGPSNSLFLIRRPNFLNSELLDNLYKVLEHENLIIALERLFKGGKCASVLYGPKRVLMPFLNILDLVELEDYSKIKSPKVIWEIGTKTPIKQSIGSLFLDFPKLETDEQVWYQMILQPQVERARTFGVQIRVAVLTDDQKRRKTLTDALQIQRSGFMKIPKPFSKSHMLDFYHKRALVGRYHIKLNALEIIKLWSLP